MNGAPSMGLVLPLTLAQATALPTHAWEDLSVSELNLTENEKARLSRLWLWLMGVEADSADAPRVRNEIASDGALMVACSLPAIELLRWLRAARWEDFDSTARTGTEAWAWSALQRVWAACEALGPMASQCSIRAPAPTVRR